MDKKQWIEYQGFYCEDMRLIDECMAFGGRITEIRDKLLDYADVKVERK